MQLFLTWFELFLSLALVVAVLIHPAKGMGLGSMGGSAQLFGSQKGAETGLNRLTGGIIVFWMGTALLLSSPAFGLKSALPTEQPPIQMPTSKAPIQMPAQQVPVSAAPAQQAPASAAPAQQAPASAAPAQQAPASAAPAQQAPASAAPAQQAPASAAPKVPTDTKPST